MNFLLFEVRFQDLHFIDMITDISVKVGESDQNKDTLTSMERACMLLYCCDYFYLPCIPLVTFF